MCSEFLWFQMVSGTRWLSTLESEMVVNGEDCCRVEEMNWITHATCVNCCHEKIARLYSATCYGIGGDASLDSVGTIIKFLPCMYI